MQNPDTDQDERDLMQPQLGLLSTKLNDAIQAYRQERFGTPVYASTPQTPEMGDAVMGIHLTTENRLLNGRQMFKLMGPVVQASQLKQKTNNLPPSFRGSLPN